MIMPGEEQAYRASHPIKYHWEEALRCHEFENMERHQSRAYGYREIGWDEETGYPNKFCGPQPPMPFWLYLLFDYTPTEIKLAFRRWQCRRFGHDWVDTSYGGPDSGCVSGYCRRCGFDYDVPLY